MRLSQRADYVMRMMVDLACMSNGQWATVSEITQRQDVAEPFMAKIASRTAVAGLLVGWLWPNRQIVLRCCK